MIILLLCVPLVIFLAAEGTIVHLMIKKIAEALWEEGFTSGTFVDGTVPSLTAIICVFALIILAIIITWVYIRFVIISAVRNRRAEKAEKEQKKYNNDNYYLE